MHPGEPWGAQRGKDIRRTQDSARTLATDLSCPSAIDCHSPIRSPCPLCPVHWSCEANEPWRPGMSGQPLIDRYSDGNGSPRASDFRHTTPTDLYCPLRSPTKGYTLTWSTEGHTTTRGYKDKWYNIRQLSFVWKHQRLAVQLHTG